MGVILILMVTGCAQQGTQQGSPTDAPAPADKAVRGSHAEVTDGDFVYRLVSEKEQYDYGDPVKVYGELEYVGEQDEITIGHAASPFYFPMKELTRDYDIGYAMNEPYFTTTLKKGEPLREYYSGGGGYGSQDKKEYKDFIRSLQDVFPDGRYVVYGSADFMIDTSSKGADLENLDGEGPQKYKIQAEIQFTVNEEKK